MIFIYSLLYWCLFTTLWVVLFLEGLWCTSLNMLVIKTVIPEPTLLGVVVNCSAEFTGNILLDISQ